MELEIVPGQPRLIRAKDAANLLGVHTTKINQYDRDNRLVVIRRQDGSVVPEEMLVGLTEPTPVDPDADDGLPPATHEPLLSLRGTITVLRDAGFGSEQIVEWMWEPDEELGATPIEALRSGQHHAVNRVAATLGT